MQTNGTASYYLNFANTADLSPPAYTMNWSDRGWFVYETLKAQMETSQAAVQAYLSNAGVEFRSFWINNSIYVKNSNATVLAGVQGFEGVESITAPPRVYHIYEPEPALNEQTMAIEPNLTVIQAPDAWAAGFNGEGYTVANIDTGVRYTHEALNASYRGKTAGGYNHNYNWYDPYSSNYQEPRDDNGHGSHTMVLWLVKLPMKLTKSVSLPVPIGLPAAVVQPALVTIPNCLPVPNSLPLPPTISVVETPTPPTCALWP